MRYLNILATVLVLAASPAFAQGHKATVAVYQMDDVAHTGQGPTFTQMLQTAIAQTNKFSVLERTQISNLVGEQARARAGLVTSNTPDKVGGFEGADYLIYGSITSASVVTKNLFGMRAQPDPRYPTVCLDAFVTLGVDIKITDSRSGEVRYTSSINSTEKAGTACVGGTRYDLTNSLRNAANKVAYSLVTTVYPIQVASVQPDWVLVLNYGEGTIQAGNVYGVYSKGESFVDPATGEKLGNNEERLGYVQVTAVQGRISRATPLGLFAQPPSIGAIVRPASKEELEQLRQQGKRKG